MGDILKLFVEERNLLLQRDELLNEFLLILWPGGNNGLRYGGCGRISHIETDSRDVRDGGKDKGVL